MDTCGKGTQARAHRKEEEEEMRPIIATTRHPHGANSPHQRNCLRQ